MIDAFVLLTPLLLLGVILIFAFVGCYAPPNPIFVSMTVEPLSGPTAGGTLLTITGEPFTANAVVKFGTPPNDIDVPATLIASGTLNVTTPAHAAGPVELVVDYTDTRDGDTLHFNGILPVGISFTFIDNVTPLLPPTLSRKTGGSSNSASLAPFAGTKLVIVTVQWGAGTGATLNTPTSPGVTFTPISVTDNLNPQQVASFYAFADLTSGIIVTATLNGSSNTDFNLLISAYDHADPTSAPASPSSKQGIGINPAPSLAFQTSALAAGDLIYAVAIARSGGTVLTGSWSADPTFVPEVGLNDYLLLETRVLAQSDIDAGQIAVTATDNNGNATSRWYLFAAAIKRT